jgi:hypothetical protein
VFSDASQNTYTGRGSGTSYATPSVSGVIALVIEANPDLDPLQIKEVLKQTAERRGPASVPDVDPYWNRDFGYGMVDAYEAVKLAQHLNQTEQSASIDPYLQNHLLDYNVTGSTATIVGHSWGQQGVVDRVEFRLGDGEWSEATYEIADNLSAGEAFNWTVVLNLDDLSKGNQILEIRAVSGEMVSLPILISVEGTGLGMESSSGGVLMYALGLAVLVMLLAAVLGWRMHSVSNELSRESSDLNQASVMDAELVVSGDESPSDDFESLTIIQLKELLQQKGISKSGNKQNLVDRLRNN